jgi:HEAT repeat protein
MTGKNMTGDLSPHDAERLRIAVAAFHSPDVLVQNEAVEIAIELGPKALRALLALQQDPGVSQPQLMYALSQIADARCTPLFTERLNDSDERIRAYAAQGLAQIGDPQAAAAALKTLNDAPDELHLDITPSVRTLGTMGLSVVPQLLDLLTSEDKMTRLHAQRALELNQKIKTEKQDGNAK